MAKWSLDAPELTLDRGDVASKIKIAQKIAPVKILDPNLAEINTKSVRTPEGLIKATEVTIAKATVAATETTDLEVRTEIVDFTEKVAKGITDFVQKPMTRGQFIKNVGLGISALVLTACGIDPVIFVPNPNQPVSKPTATETFTPTEAPTETATPTATETFTLTETPAPPPEFESQMAGTKYSVKDNEILFTPDNGQAAQIATVENGKFVFTVNGQEVNVDPKLAEIPDAEWFLNGKNDQIMAVYDDSDTYWKYEYNMTTGEWEEKSLPEVSTNVNYPTEIEWNDMVGNRWATAVRQAIASGKIPTFTNKVVIEGPSPDNSLPIGKYLEFNYFDGKYATYTETRPVIYSAYAVVSIGNENFETLTEQIANNSGGYTLANVKDTKYNKIKNVVNDQSTGIMPIMFYNNRDMCLAISDNSVYCDWYMNGMNAAGQEALTSWENTSNLPKWVETTVFDNLPVKW